MELKKYVFTMLALITIGTKIFVYGGDRQVAPVYREVSQESLAELYKKAGLDNPDVIINTLINLGISKEELTSLMGEGKKIYNIIQDKNIKQSDFKDALSKQYEDKIKEAVKNKIITKKESRLLTKLLKQRMENWHIEE